MSDYKVSIRYATSLLEMATEKNALDVIAKDMELVYSTLESNLQLKTVLASPVIKSHIKLSILTEIFKPVVSQESMSFLKFVVDKSREDVLYSILKKFLELKDECLGIVNVNVLTASDFSEDQETALRAKMESMLNKKVRLIFKTDRQIIGGFIAKVGDTVFDASLRHQLDLLKKQFITGGASLN